MRVFLLFCLLWGGMPPAPAHPHMWIDVQVEPLRNAAGEIAALRQRWQFDPFFSGVFLQDMASLPEAERAPYWSQLQADMLNTLREARFYTYPQARFAEAEAVRLSAQADALVLELRLPLVKPSFSLEYQVYEPSYYAEMLHSREQVREQNGCTLTLRDATPDDALRAQAAALDQGESGDADLGRWFAEQAVWQCR